MRNESHKTLIGYVRAHVIAWRKQQGWSRESVVQVIVEAHERIHGPAATGIDFHPSTRDAFERQKVNADRVFRWFDDESKDTNHLPANFIPSILAAMPMDLRIRLLDDLLRPAGLTVTCIEQGESVDFDAMPHLRAMIKETSEAHLALVGLTATTATLGDLERARQEVADVQESTSRTSRALAGAIARLKAGGASIVRHFEKVG